MIVNEIKALTNSNVDVTNPNDSTTRLAYSLDQYPRLRDSQTLVSGDEFHKTLHLSQSCSFDHLRPPTLICISPESAMSPAAKKEAASFLDPAQFQHIKYDSQSDELFLPHPSLSLSNTFVRS